MSDVAEERSSSEKGWLRKRRTWIIAAIVLLLLATGVVITIVSSSPVPEVGGGLMIEADPGTRIYAGDKQVGTTQVSFSWGELFGDERHSPSAVELSNPDQAITAEMLSGPGATKISSPSGMGIAGTWNVQITQQSAHLTRRADGALDAVFALILVWSPPNQDSRSYLLPVPLRKGSAPSTLYFDSAGVAITGVPPPAFMRLFGRSPNESKTICRFSAGSPPSQFAEEIEAKGLWEYQDLDQPWFQKKSLRIIGACFLCLLAAGVAMARIRRAWFRAARSSH